MAARHNPATLVAVASQPEMDTQGGDVEGPQVAGSPVRTAILDNLWLAGLTQMQATYAQCPEGRPGWLPKCLLNQGRCPAEYLTLLPSPVARVITSARSSKLCAMDLMSDLKFGSITDGVSAHMHSCMHCGRAQRDAMAATVHRMLQCATMESNVAQFKAEDFGQRIDWDASPDALLLSILSPEWEDKPSRETKVLYWNAVATFFRLPAAACPDSTDEEDDGSGLEDSSTDILTVSVLQGSQVAPGVVNVLADMAEI